MTKRALFILTLTVLVSMLVSASVLAANKNIADKVNGYNVPTRQAATMQVFDKSEELQLQRAADATRRMPLGSALSDGGRGVGTMVDVTYEDMQLRWNSSRQVALSSVSGQVNAHFAYDEFSDIVDTLHRKRSGYNVYDATAGEWPQDQGSGCLLQPSPTRGGVYVGIDVTPDGLAAAYVVSDAEGQWYDTGYTHDFWYQDELNSCSFTNTWIPQATLAGVFSNATYRGGWPSMVTQLNGTDVITHTAVLEMGGGFSRIVYFRKVGAGATGTWTNGTYIDTTVGLYRIAAEKNGTKVAVIYCQTTDSGRLYGTTYQFLDNDIKYRESTNGGVTWAAKVNITRYDAFRPNSISGAATYNAYDGCYDVNHNLHIVWVAQEVPIKPYRNVWNFGDFNGDLWHWNAATPTAKAKVADGTYDPITQPGYWNGGPTWQVVCGFGPGNGQSYIHKPQIAQCGNYMYAIWNQMHSKINLTLPGTHEDTAAAGRDCATTDLADRSGESNWEVFVSVSKDLVGDLWDAQRNLTNTYTPGCHPESTATPVCGDEWNPSLSLQEFDADGLEDLVWPSNLITPTPTEGSPTFTSNKYLQVTYLEDKVPSSWWLHDGTTYIEANGTYPTLNDVKWFRMACVEPEVYPLIQVDRGDFVWADDYFIADSTQTYTVTVTNAGNATLNVTDIQTTETTGSGWLDVSTTALTIPAGTSNTATFNIIVSPAAGAPTWLEGSVTIISNAHNKPSWPITINTLAAEVITDAKYDTCATSTAWDTKGGRGLGDNIALVVSNYGEIGNSGEAGTSMDFTVAGGDCDSGATWYLYTNSPFYIQNVGAAYNLTTSHYGASNGYQSREDSWDPASGTVMSRGTGSHGGADFDSVYAGKSFNRDTTVAIERTFFAPRNNPGNPSFIVTKTKLYSVGGAARNAIAFGTATDWDVPADSGSANTSAVKLTNGGYVYFQGTNDADSARCQSNLERFGAEVFAGWYTRAEYAADPLANNETFVGMKGLNVRNYFDTDTITDLYDAALWWTATGTGDLTAESTLKDQGGFVTFLHNYNLAANDTLTFWTILATQHTGTINTFDSTITNAKVWYNKLRAVGCCQLMGNLDQSTDNIVGMGDLTVLIDHLFITLAPLVCDDEGNMDLSVDGLVGMGDLTVLIDNLFITLTPLPTCAQLP